MNLDKDMCYKIIQANDPRFDGVFYVGVASTGIYCRTICKVPTPKKDNCNYFKSPGEAEEEGYRPCLRCRPEMAPNYSEFKQGQELIHMILEYFEQNNYKTGVIGEAGEYFGISTRHINRIFHDELGIGPRDYIMTKRLLRGKVLLTDTQLSIGDISNILGFSSGARFSSTFKKHYRLTPSSIRKQKKVSGEFIKIKLSYRPPYRWDIMMNFLKVRAIPHVEEVTDDGVYKRALRVEENGDIYSGWLEVEPLEDEAIVVVKVSNSLEKVILIVIEKVKRVFDLDTDPKQLPEILDSGVRLPGSFDSFEMATRAILGQQVSVKAATTFSGRIAENLGKEVITPWKEIDRLFPSETKIAELNNIGDILGPLGVIRSRSETISSLAKEMCKGTIDFRKSRNIDKLGKLLLDIKGIGPWSVQYLLIRGCSWPDAFPVSDLVIKNNLMTYLYDEDGVKLSDKVENCSKYILNKKYEKSAIKWSEEFRPWRGYMAIGIWNNLVDWS